jgi:putrescine:ornithine antiporter
VIGIVYSVYALFAAGTDAVMGGMLVMGLGWLIWLFHGATLHVDTRYRNDRTAARGLKGG